MRGSDDGSVIGGATADYDLSQQVFTIMSYNDGWTTSPYGQPASGGLTGTEVDHFGWVGTLARSARRCRGCSKGGSWARGWKATAASTWSCACQRRNARPRSSQRC